MKFLSSVAIVPPALLLLVAVARPAALSPRTDVNPALLYWQGFNAMPSLSADDSRHILDDPPTLSIEEGTRACARFDAAFRCFRRAARMKATCDWGIDLADGPQAFMPNLIKTRQVANTGVARAYYALRSGRANEAVEDLLAVLALGRHTAVDGTLVSTMIGVAVDNRVLGFIAGNFAAFPAPALEALARGIDDAPARTTVKQAMMGEEAAILDWFLSRLEGIRTAYPKDEARAVKELKSVLTQTLGNGNDEVTAGGIVQAAGNSLDGVAEYLKQMRPVYGEVLNLAEASPEDLPTQITRMEKLVTRNTNLLVRALLPSVGKARGREIEGIVRLAMVRAALERQLRGEAAFKAMADPFGTGPFEVRRFKEEDESRWFELESQIQLHGLQGTMKFSEAGETK